MLMLFIYLELGAMVGIYFKTNHLPVRFLIYVGITAMIRHLIGLITDHGDNHTLIIFYCIGIFVLSLSIFMVRYSSYKFPSEKIIEEKPEESKIIEKYLSGDLRDEESCYVPYTFNSIERAKAFVKEKYKNFFLCEKIVYRIIPDGMDDC